MSQEIKTTTQISYLKNNVTEKITFATSVDVSGSGMVRLTKAAATGDATLALGGITTIGQFYFHNCDDTNNILIGADGSSYPLELKPGEDARGRWNGAAVHFKSNAGTPLLEYFLSDD